MCQSGQDPKEVNQLLEIVLDGFWPKKDFDIPISDRTQTALRRLALLFDISNLAPNLEGIYQFTEIWAEWEDKYDERFGEETCTRELDKFFLIKTLAEWEK